MLSPPLVRYFLRNSSGAGNKGFVFAHEHQPIFPPSIPPVFHKPYSVHACSAVSSTLSIGLLVPARRTELTEVWHKHRHRLLSMQPGCINQPCIFSTGWRQFFEYTQWNTKGILPHNQVIHRWYMGYRIQAGFPFMLTECIGGHTKPVLIV